MATLRHGHTIYGGYPPDVAIKHDASTQAHCTYRHILAEATRVLADDGNARHLEIKGQNLWLLENVGAVIRFKKTDANGVSSNYPTKQARDFGRGEPENSRPSKDRRKVSSLTTAP